MRECVGIRAGFSAAGCDYFGSRYAVKLIRFKIDGRDYAISPAAVVWAETVIATLTSRADVLVPMSFAEFAEALERAMGSAPAVMP